MGIQLKSVELLIHLARSGVPFGRTVTIGRQLLMVEGDVVRSRVAAGMGDGAAAPLAELERGDWADPLLLALGAASVDALDASDYEGATLLHDLNEPLGDDLRERFDLVIDGGSLEHVFDFPRALRSCLELVRLGGRIVFMSPADNFCGHGFYQFSPELFFSVLRPPNGFELELALLAQDPERRTPLFQVVDPARLGRRVNLTSGRPVTQWIVAKRVAAGPVLTHPPAQSDYATLWSGGALATAGPGVGRVGRWIRAELDTVQERWPAVFELRRAVRAVVAGPRGRGPTFNDTEAFRRFEWDF